MKPIPTSDECVWAAVAHGSILLLGFGPLVSLIIWITQRNKSAYVATQSLQALLYQALQPVILMLVELVFAIIDIILVIVLTFFFQKTSAGRPASLFLFEFVPFIILFGAFGLYFLGGLVAAGLCLAGREAQYPWLGGWLVEYLNHDPQQMEERQDRAVACACHLGAFISLWGFALPLIAWLSERKRSVVLRFQGLQAWVYQIMGVVLGILFVVAYFAISILFTLVVILAVPASNPSNSQWVFILTMLPLLTLFLIVAPGLLLGPLYQTFALIAAWQVSHDRDYRYPILGKLIASRINI